MEETMQQEAENQDIELELPEGEGDVPAVEVVEETTAQQESKKDELDQISDSVQKRIDKLTYKMREAERQRDEAVNYAQSVNQTASTLKEKLKNSDSSLFKEYDNRVQSEIAGAKQLLKDAKALEEAGVFSIVLEKIPAELAKKVTKELSIPTIGIGAGAHCDGQVLVIHDMLGLNKDFSPRFLRRYEDLHSKMTGAVTHYIKDVKNGDFPNEDEQYS